MQIWARRRRKLSTFCDSINFWRSFEKFWKSSQNFPETGGIFSRQTRYFEKYEIWSTTKNDDFCKIPTVIESQQASPKNRYLLGKPLLTAENNIFSCHILVHIDTLGRVPIISGTYRQISSCVPRNSCTRDVAYQKRWYMELYSALQKLVGWSQSRCALARLFVTKNVFCSVKS